ncbi:MAG TPA: ATP-binding protein, partial [Micromonosporaceae bacterium]|nr:ATP-binding protein [Micromonosporaceae bacterium]
MPTVWPRGQLDLAGSAVLRSVLPRMLAEEPDGIIVDLSGISVHKPTRAEAWPPVRRARRTPGATSKVRERFPPEPQSLAAARAMAAAACARWQVPERPTGRVQVVLTELVGNAVRHAGTPIEVVLR